MKPTLLDSPSESRVPVTLFKTGHLIPGKIILTIPITGPNPSLSVQSLLVVETGVFLVPIHFIYTKKKRKNFNNSDKDHIVTPYLVVIIDR